MKATKTQEKDACPECGGMMLSPRSVFFVRRDGVPVSRYVCRECARRWALRPEMQRKREAAR
jgi:transposase-like protein